MGKRGRTGRHIGGGSTENCINDSKDSAGRCCEENCALQHLKRLSIEDETSVK